MDIKWTAGPGPAPLPYSKRAREALGVTDDVSRNCIYISCCFSGNARIELRTLYQYCCGYLELRATAATLLVPTVEQAAIPMRGAGLSTAYYLCERAAAWARSVMLHACCITPWIGSRTDQITETVQITQIIVTGLHHLYHFARG